MSVGKGSKGYSERGSKLGLKGKFWLTDGVVGWEHSLADHLTKLFFPLYFALLV